MNGRYTGREPKIFMTIFTQNERVGWIHPSYWEFALNSRHLLAEAGQEIGATSIDLVGDRVHEFKPQSVARQECVRKFLDSDCTHLLMMDNDNPPSDVIEKVNPFKMLRGMAVNSRQTKHHRFDIIAAAVITIKAGGMQPFTIYKRHYAHDAKTIRPFAGEEILRSKEFDGFMEADAAGTGMMLIERHVIEAMHPYCFVADLNDAWSREFYNVYNGTGWPEDIYFTRRAREIHGFEIAGDFETPCSHYHTVDLLQTAVDQRERRQDAAQKS